MNQPIPPIVLVRLVAGAFSRGSVVVFVYLPRVAPGIHEVQVREVIDAVGEEVVEPRELPEAA